MITLQGDLFIIMKAKSYRHTNTHTHTKKGRNSCQNAFFPPKIFSFCLSLCVRMIMCSRCVRVCLQTWIQKKTQRNKFYSLFVLWLCSFMTILNVTGLVSHRTNAYWYRIFVCNIKCFCFIQWTNHFILFQQYSFILLASWNFLFAFYVSNAMWTKRSHKSGKSGKIIQTTFFVNKILL